MRAFFRFLTIIPSRPRGAQKTVWVCVTCVSPWELLSLMFMLMVMASPSSHNVLQFFREFTLSLFCLDSSTRARADPKPVCFAVKVFILYVDQTLKYCWACCIHQCIKSTCKRVMRGRDSPSLLSWRRSLFPAGVLKRVYTERCSTNYMHIQI